MNKLLANKRIWITGASRGIGLAIYRKLADSSASIVLSASSQKSFNHVSDEIEQRGNTLTLPFDMSSSDGPETAYKLIEEKSGGIDILINNAGVVIFNKLWKSSIEEYDRMMNINLRGAFLTMKAVLPGMIQLESGLIVNISSVSAKTVFRNNAVYSASKAGLLMMSRCLREEVRNNGIRVIDVLPGATSTEIWNPEAREKFADTMMKAEDVAEIIYSNIINSLNGKAVTEEIIIRPSTGDL